MVANTLAELRKRLQFFVDHVGDSRAALVLEFGQSFQPAPRPKGVRLRSAGSCFKSAWDWVDKSRDHSYVEGYGLAGGFGLPIHHAWAATPDGVVVDRVWREPEECAYFGIAFDFVELCQHLTDGYSALYGPEDWDHWRVVLANKLANKPAPGASVHVG
jgi:hypothetical protein